MASSFAKSLLKDGLRLAHEADYERHDHALRAALYAGAAAYAALYTAQVSKEWDDEREARDATPLTIGYGTMEQALPVRSDDLVAEVAASAAAFEPVIVIDVDVKQDSDDDCIECGHPYGGNVSRWSSTEPWCEACGRDFPA